MLANNSTNESLKMKHTQPVLSKKQKKKKIGKNEVELKFEQGGQTILS